MKQNDKRSAGIHVGSASIIMIFAVLCLTVFSTLSYVTANQEQKLAEKSARAIEQYYAADWQCEAYYEEIYKLLQAGVAASELPQYLDVKVTSDGAAACIAYAADIDERQKLQVQLIAENGSLRTETWAVTVKEQHEYNDELAVWDGE